MAVANGKELPTDSYSLSFSRRSLSSDSLESFTSEISRSQSVAGDRTTRSHSALYSKSYTHVSAFPPPRAPPQSASTLDLRENGKRFPKSLRNIAKKFQRKMSSTSASDLATESQADSAISSADTALTLSASDLSDTFRLRMGTLNRRLHLKDSHASGKGISTATLFGHDHQRELDKSLQQLNLTVDEVDSASPFPNMDVNPFGAELQGAIFEEVYKSALGCFVNGAERLVSEHGDLADQYLRKAFKLSTVRHQELLRQAQLEQKPDLTLHVKVKRADYLIARKGHGKSDPYCKLAVVKADQVHVPQRDLADWRKERTLGELLICQTDVKYRTLEPEWNQDFSIQLKDSCSGFLAVEIWDSEDKIELRQIKGLKGLRNYLKDLRGGNDFLGKTFVGLNDLPLKGEESWFDLQSHRGRPRGRVQIKLHIDIKMKGVAHGLALEYYEKLFEALCTFESRWTKTSSTPDLASLEAQDKWNADWSGRLTPSAVMLLSLYASQHNITKLEQAIVHLNSLLKYHRCYHISLSAFQDVYTTILSLQEELEQDTAAEDEGAAIEKLSQNWQTQKLYACTRFLCDEIHDVIRNHPVELNPTSSLETERLRQQIGLLKDLYKVKVFQNSLSPEEANLSEVIATEIEQSFAHWYRLLEKKAKEESPSKLFAYLGLVRSVAAFIKTSREALQPIFAEVEVDYLERVYVAVEGQLAGGLPDALTEDLPQTPHTAYILYLSLKEFKSFSTFISEQWQDQLKLTDFHVHFHGMVNDWIGLAALRFKDAVMRATQTAEEEETVTEEAKFSSTARDLVDLVVVVCSFWKNLDWPVASESFVYLTTLIKNVCSGVVMFSNECCRRVQQANFFNPNPDTFMTTKKLCIALNDIDQVRRGVQELPEFINWSHFKEVMAAETSPEEADKADKVLKGILSDMDQSILQELTSLTGGIAEKMRPDIKLGLKKVMLATSPEAVEEVISPLMTYLHGNLQELRTSLFRSVFLELLSRIWIVLVEKMWRYVSSTRNETVTFCFHSLLNLLYGFFHAEGEGLAKEKMENKEYTLLHEVLAYRVMPTDKVIQQYYQTLADFQAKAPTTKGTVTVMVGYMREKQAVELKLVRAANLPPVTVGKSCDAYLKMSLLLPDKDFSTATRQKSKVYKQSLNPVLDELFSFPVTRQQHLQVEGAVLAIEVYSYDRLHAHTPIGVVVIKCKDIPALAPNTVPEDNELVLEPPQKLTLNLPIFIPCDSPALNELSERSKDAVAIAFAKRMRKLKAGLPTSRTAVQKLNNHLPKRLFKMRRFRAPTT